MPAPKLTDADAQEAIAAAAAGRPLDDLAKRRGVTVKHLQRIAKGYRPSERKCDVCGAPRLKNRMCVGCRLWPRVDKSGGHDACWPWTGVLNANGYPLIEVLNRPRLAHRIAYELLHGPIPRGLCVCHRCDNPLCMNPSWFIGTRADNNLDMRRKGRASPPPTRRGEANNAARFTIGEVVRMRELYAAGASGRGLAAKYDTAGVVVLRIVRGEAWAHAPGPITVRRARAVSP